MTWQQLREKGKNFLVCLVHIQCTLHENEIGFLSAVFSGREYTKRNKNKIDNIFKMLLVCVSLI